MALDQATPSEELPPDTPTSLSECLEVFAESLDAPIEGKERTLVAAVLMASSFKALANLLRQLSTRGKVDISDANAQADSYRGRIQTLTSTQAGGSERRAVLTPEMLQRDDDYFPGLAQLAQELDMLAVGLLNHPSESSFNRLPVLLDDALKRPVLQKDRLAFDLNLLGAVNRFTNHIDWTDNRDKTNLSTLSLSRLVDSLPEDSANLLSQIEAGPLQPGAAKLVSMMKRKGAE